MYQSTSLLTVLDNSRIVLAQATEALQTAGLRVVQSFDLQAARAVHTGCSCPNHGTDQCDCQFVVLLVYGQPGGRHWGEPVTLVIHGRDGVTELALVDTPQQPANSDVRAAIRTALSEGNPSGWSFEQPFAA